MATGHTPPGASLWPKGAPHLRPHRGGGPSPTGHIRHRLPHWPEKGRAKPPPHRPPTGHKGEAIGGRPSHRPSLATLPPFGRPTGAYGHRLTHWPPTGPLLAIRGGLPLAKGEAPTGQRDGRGSLRPHGSSSPPTSRPPMAKGEPHPSLATHWPKGTGRGRLRPALPPTGHLRPTWPSEAFGHLLPHPHTSR